MTREAQHVPTPACGPRHRPDWLATLPDELKPLLKEIYDALDVGAYGLATMGMRGMFDLVAVRTVGDVGSFAQKLDALRARGLISLVDRERLEVVIAAGNAAAHRGHILDARGANQLMDCVEHLLRGLYAFQEPLRALRSVIPQRR